MTPAELLADRRRTERGGRLALAAARQRRYRSTRSATTNVIFYDTSDPNVGIEWFRVAGEGTGNGTRLSAAISGSSRAARNLLGVDIDSDPSEKPRAEEDVEFTADPEDLLDGEEVTSYEWNFGDGDTDRHDASPQ